MPCPAPSDDKTAALTRMRRLATGLLGLMAALYVAARLLRRLHPGFEWLAAFAEAGMVGGLADWFAVTALFRRPLGLPIPHTAILPARQARIGAALGDFIAESFITETLVGQALSRFDPARNLAELIGGAEAAPAPHPALADGLARAAVDLVQSLPPERLRSGLAGLLTPLAEQMLSGETPSAAPAAAARALRLFWSPDRSRSLTDQLVSLVTRSFTERRPLLRDQLMGQGGGWKLPWIDKVLADRMLAALEGLLSDLQAPDHPLRGELDRRVLELADRLDGDPALGRLAQGWGSDLVRSGLLTEAAHGLADRLVAADPAPLADALGRSLAPILTELETRLRSDEALRQPLNDRLRSELARRIVAQRAQLGGLVAERVADWDTGQLVDTLERQVGRDLQYIRINGALAGGLAGLVIHALARLLHLD